MSTDHARPTPEQAREQLVAARGAVMASPMDRRVHAGMTAALGLALGLAMASRNLVPEAGWTIATALIFAVWFGACLWVERVVNTVPRRAKLSMRLGIGASMVVALVAVVPWLNLQDQTEPNTWPMVVLATLIIVLPSLLAAAVIVRGRG